MPEITKKKSKKARKLEYAARRANRCLQRSVVSSGSDRPFISTICGHCNQVTTNLDSHLDWNHVNEVTVEVWPGEQLTIHRSGGFFHCPWCADKTKPGHNKTRIRSAREMKVSIL